MNLIVSWLATIGGPVVAALLLFSIAASTLIFIKSYQYWASSPKRAVKADQLLQLFAQGQSQQIAEHAKHQTNARIQLIGQAQELINQRQLNLDYLRQELLRRARILLTPLQAYLRPLEIIATLSPLLGLFGTVLGMIEAFKAMEAAGSQVDPAVLSGGIWQALLTTAVGLAVAIPVTLIHGAFEKKAENVAAAMQNDIGFILTQLASELEDASPSSSLRRA